MQQPNGNCRADNFPHTIRNEINIAFLVFFVLIALLVLGGYNNFRRLDRAVEFFTLAEDLDTSILEMRRNEKNFFILPEQFSYDETLEYAGRVQTLLDRHGPTFRWGMGDAKLNSLRKELQSYVALMNQLRNTSPKDSSYGDVKASIRARGEALLAITREQAGRKRGDVKDLLRQTMHYPLITLAAMALLLVLTLYVTNRRILGPLRDITENARGIAEGAFRRIPEKPGRRNEIYNLVAALNRMMDEIETRQDQLVQSSKIAAIGTLTSGIAHELNNPINNLGLIVESLMEDGEEMTSDERMRLYEEALDQADRASETVKNLLEFSRASHPRLEEVSLEEVFGKIQRLLQNEMDLHDIQFSLNVRRDLPLMYLDRSGLQQVLLNLMLNAIQAMGNGGRLEVRADFAAGRREVRIDVTDNGPGIPPEHLKQIFDPFFTTKPEGQGTGLGLSVSYSIIKKQGGRMEVKSAEGAGTRFSIFLPRRNKPAAAG